MGQDGRWNTQEDKVADVERYLIHEVGIIRRGVTVAVILSAVAVILAAIGIWMARGGSAEPDGAATSAVERPAAQGGQDVVEVRGGVEPPAAAAPDVPRDRDPLTDAFVSGVEGGSAGEVTGDEDVSAAGEDMLSGDDADPEAGAPAPREPSGFEDRSGVDPAGESAVADLVADAGETPDAVEAPDATPDVTPDATPDVTPDPPAGRSYAPESPAEREDASGSAPGAADVPEPAGDWQFRVGASAMAPDVVDLEPVEPADWFSGGASRIFCWTRIETDDLGLIPDEERWIEHQWFRDGVLVHDRRITIGSVRYRVYSMIGAGRAVPGDWRVEIRDSRARLVDLVRFTVG